jgi:hypothetical protein
MPSFIALVMFKFSCLVIYLFLGQDSAFALASLLSTSNISLEYNSFFKTEKKELGWTRGTYGGDGRCIHGFDGQA